MISTQFTNGVEYSLHCLVYLIDLPSGTNIRIKELATYQGISESYLSKFFTKLVKAGIVRSVPGVKGGYELARKPEEITFWDVVQAIQGKNSFFQCKEIRSHILPYREGDLPRPQCQDRCLINSVMLEAEQHMKTYLSTKTIAWLHEKLDQNVAELQRIRKQWFAERVLT
jgi:Rrf2 family protein